MLKRAIAALAITFCALVVGIPAASVQADPYRGSGRGRGQYTYNWNRPNPAWNGFWGGVLGGWVAQALRPGRDAPEAELEPWSKAWFVYCSNRYRSFDPPTGTYLGFDGERKFCK